MSHKKERLVSQVKQSKSKRRQVDREDEDKYVKNLTEHANEDYTVSLEEAFRKMECLH